ncbi:MAG: hypothetical protein KJN63_01540 [Acidimicrobiia bacterium]|nr:hypothetical protein [Acidimicrobiia bacterium]
MAPDFGETQANQQLGSPAQPVLVHDARDEVDLPAMDDLDRLVAELDVIDATLAQLG